MESVARVHRDAAVRAGVLPAGVWWYYASLKDRKTVREYLEMLHSNGYHNPLVAAADYEESQGTRGVELPSVIKPWWIFVVAGAFAVGIISGLILP